MFCLLFIVFTKSNIDTKVRTYMKNRDDSVRVLICKCNRFAGCFWFFLRFSVFTLFFSKNHKMRKKKLSKGDRKYWDLLIDCKRLGFFNVWNFYLCISVWIIITKKLCLKSKNYNVFFCMFNVDGFSLYLLYFYPKSQKWEKGIDDHSNETFSSKNIDVINHSFTRVKH